MRTRTLVMVLVLAVAAVMGAVSQEMPSSGWMPGTYWTYHTDVLSNGVCTEGTLTFLVLIEDASYGRHRWHLAVITEWYDGTEILATATHSAPANPFPWRRWPLITNYLPPKHLPDFSNYFPQVVSSMGLPWLGEALSMRVDIHESEAWIESIVLTEIQQGAENVSECVVGDTVAIQYEWTTSYLNSEAKHVEGTAWWSLQSGWWAYTEGQGPEGTYEVCLSSSGVLTGNEMALRLADALSSTTAIDPEYADGLRGVFERLGVDVLAK